MPKFKLALSALIIGTLTLSLLSLGLYTPSKATTTTTYSFESDLEGWQSSDSSAWQRDSSGTPSSSTGPSSAKSGSYYAYLEASSPNYSYKTFYLTSPSFTEAIYSVDFYYHMYGSTMGTLALEYYDGSNWVEVWSKSGQQHSSDSSSWTQATVSLSGQTISQVRFKGTTGSSYKSDMAVDYITIQTQNFDTNPPVITLNGDSQITIQQYETYTDPGATALDDIDGELSVTTSGTVDTNLAGTYVITYTATDSAGNTAQENRTVIVSEVFWREVEGDLFYDGSVKIESDLTLNGKLQLNGSVTPVSGQAICLGKCE